MKRKLITGEGQVKRLDLVLLKGHDEPDRVWQVFNEDGQEVICFRSGGVETQEILGEAWILDEGDRNAD